MILVWLVSSSALVLARLAPGDFSSDLLGGNITPAAAVRERARLGLDRPISSDYFSWLRRAMQLDFGRSFRFGRPVTLLVGERAGNTAVLAVVALALATCLGLPAGVVTGSRTGALPAVIRGASIACLSVPPLLMSILLVLVAARTGWFPIGGMGEGATTGMAWPAALRDLAWHLVLPALALALPVAAVLERVQAQATREVLSEPYILAAAARGVPPARLIWRHGLRGALRTSAAVYGVIIGSLLSGSFAVEIVTSWPGLGRLMYDALVSRDIYLVAGCAAAGSALVAMGSLLSDLTLAAVDPVLRESA